jgi:CBS domain-containing protein
MHHIPAIKTVMTAFPYSIDVDAPITEAREFMREHGIRHLPVTEQDRLKGVLTDRDMKLYLGLETTPSEEKTIKVRDVYLEGPYVVDMEERLDHVLMEMVDRHIGSVLITRHGRLAGLFTASDACRSFAEHLREQFHPPGGNDAA